ncbi:MAG: RIP metalloprotease RseP [bacterium]
MAFAQPLLFLIIALSILVLVHEWGHYFVARRLGVRVLKFSIGFGPELLGITHGDTRWSISAIPFGGYVKFAGDNPDEGSEGLSDEFLRKPLPTRAAIVLAGPVMNYILAIVLFAVVILSAGREVPPPSRVGSIMEGSVAETMGLEGGDFIRAVNGKPVSTWESFTTELHKIKGSEPFALTVERDGQSVELQGESEKGFDRGGMLGVYHFRPAVLGFVKRGGPAWNAGLRAHDRILAVDGQPVEGWASLSHACDAVAGREVPIRYERDGQTYDARLTPDRVEVAGEDGETRVHADIAVGAWVETVPVGLGQAIAGGFEETWGLTRQVLGFLPSVPGLVFEGLKRMVTGQEPSDEGLGGPVRMAQMFGEAARWGLVMFLGLMANISAQLAIFNLLPIPVLDGGHLALYTVEAITRRPPSIRVQVVLQQIGFALLLLLMLSVTVMDVGRTLG